MSKSRERWGHRKDIDVMVQSEDKSVNTASLIDTDCIEFTCQGKVLLSTYHKSLVSVMWSFITYMQYIHY